MLTIVAKHERRGHNWYWQTICECGTPKLACAANLLNGSVTNCGCDTFRRRSLVGRTHGKSRTTEHTIWRCLRERCLSRGSPSYPGYGGRGIKVCERWGLFENFLADMGPRPSTKYSIDRIDVNGDYCPENCRWATSKTQNNNRRDTVMLMHDGVSKPLALWADEIGIDRVTLWMRVFRLGWDHSRAITKPLRSAKGRF